MPANTVEIPQVYLDILRKSGGRVTPIITTLLQRLYAQNRVYSPQQIKDELSQVLCCEIGFPTIYRAIDRLMQCRILYRMHRDDGQTMFFACRHPGHEHHHHHFICTDCSRVYEIDMCLAHQYEAHVASQLDATVSKHIFQLEGICKECRK